MGRPTPTRKLFRPRGIAYGFLARNLILRRGLHLDSKPGSQPGRCHMEEFVACFSDVADPRQDNARHDLHEILLIALCTMLCGGEDCSDMEEFGRPKEPFLREFLRLKHGVPSHDTFSRVFRLLDPKPFQACFVRFMQRFVEGLEGVIAVDGKTMRGSLDRAGGKSPLHTVHAWAADRRLLLGQIATDEKSNEITAVPKLLEMLTSRGCIVTADAMSCQRAICGQIVAQGGDYVIALKGNQGTLRQDGALFLEDTERPAEPPHTTVDNDHGRIETRTGEVCADIAWLQEQHAWPGLAAIGKIVRTRETRERSRRKLHTTYLARSLRLNGSPRWPAHTGASRTGCTGSWT